MQKRFCVCGAHVWVEYKMLAETIQPLFHMLPHRAGVTLHRCPTCGRPLHIDDLA